MLAKGGFWIGAHPPFFTDNLIVFKSMAYRGGGDLFVGV